eukprot:953680-Prymnesium_polylepis.1
MGATPDMDGAKSTKIESIEASPTSRRATAIRGSGPTTTPTGTNWCPICTNENTGNTGHQVSIEGTLSMRCGDHPRVGER